MNLWNCMPQSESNNVQLDGRKKNSQQIETNTMYSIQGQWEHIIYGTVQVERFQF